MRYFSSNTSQLAIEVSFAVSLRLCTPFREVIDPAKLSNETSFKMDSILICTHLLVNQKAPCSRSTTFRGIQLCHTLTLVVQIKQILRRYKQPPVFFLISMAHIKAYFPSIRPQNNKKDSKIDPSLRRRLIIRENNHARTHARNKRFQLPLIPTANQILWHCSNNQSALQPKSGRSEHKLVRV